MATANCKHESQLAQRNPPQVGLPHWQPIPPLMCRPVRYHWVMKVVILAGGLGTRMREETAFRPKPMVEVGGKPILWHIMKVFAAYGHTDFIVCTGYKAEMIRDYFYNFGPKNLDFTIRLGDQSSAAFHGSHDEFNWTVTVVDTGFDTPTGGRISRVEEHLNGEPFFCTYGDGLAPVNLDELLASHERIATMTVTRPVSRFGVVDVAADRSVKSFSEKPAIDSFVNMGYFVFEPEIFRYLQDDSVLEEAPLRNLTREEKLGAYVHDGFWQPMDTYRESLIFNGLWDAGNAPWKIW